MFSKRFIGFLVAPVATALSLLGPAPKAEGANVDTSSQFGGSVIFQDFNVSWGGFEDSNGRTSTILSVLSHTHSTTSAFVSFYTLANDTSEGYALLDVSGVKNTTLTTSEGQMSMSMDVGGVYINQASGIGAGLDYDGRPYNVGSAILSISPIDLLWGNISYHEYVWQDDPSHQVYWSMLLTAHFSFGPGEAGDALGRPFAAPTPGTTATLGLAGIVALRRRRAA